MTRIIAKLFGDKAMKIALLCIPLVMFGFDFEWGVEHIYPITSSTLEVRGGGVAVDFSTKNIAPSALYAKRILKTSASVLAIDDNLSYYYHNRAKPANTPLARFAKIYDSASDNAPQCFIVARNVQPTALNVKSRAMLLDLGDMKPQDSKPQFYIFCAKAKDYIR